MIPTLLAFVVLFVGVPLNLYVVHRLWQLVRAEPDNAVLRDRVIVALAVLLLIVVFGLIFLNNDLDAPVVSFADTKLGTRTVAVILAIVPASYWLWIYRGAA